MLYTLAIHLYALIVELLSPFHRKARMMRFGQWKTNGILRDKIDPEAKYIWFHASSLGEFEQGRPMMEKIKADYPQYKILLTFFSPSGYEVRKNYIGADVICYLPFDTPFKVRKFLRLANPCMAIFIKYEFWANYLTELKKRDIPTYIISAIFRPNQLFFKWYGRPYRKVLHCFNHLFVQDKASADLLSEYGVNNVTVLGDTRFDRVLDVQKQAKAIPVVEQFVKAKEGEKQITLIAGSSWPQDEEFIIQYFNEHPEMKLIIAPHEIDRGHLLEIHSKLKRPSLRLSEANEKNVSQKDCLIIDSFGLLSSIYRYGDIAYIGGGFGKGIHNTLEAAVYGIPVLFGPNYQKFKEARDIIAIGGGFSVANENDFIEKMDELLTYRDLLISAGEAAGNFVQNNAGATNKILAQLPL
ncbi:3-deoxy-D-manno-octulosonic-acid transferase [Parabacteroides sp. PF5-5]|uniref:3-deoxy-D-manno-octulosonic acid transferase n=1 Tax=unclassified Parabacteroides TaxID=2649774 RepID=UPI0024764068|nr:MULTISPECIES: glycosyltransferase N-terminal domain-containing protein [unclassified Parabacteroides]MDH6305386.1 3-deoxy-D-manno-octulosonic-acid transferase [Parabacteroides sp. PH5-39]MDH6316096.1 3-deoxy-D-manno-octulosonic-acid transferase [Parabacteroides sp. PF5-13]MDH6320246.1 3-deoxy-D-manno-octulosonic-acid transferase [Parabacteroides sp. PH5-13]MDH6323976.1 3-deoxy-D-manno-octulosonic-acid transferase [Parabacteroides sp. PH5-8]MDH6327287.1 3-deoxy-D-manno-octulosonic-acid trans